MALVDFHTDDHVHALVDIPGRRSSGYRQRVLHVRVQRRLDERGVRLIITTKGPPLHDDVSSTIQ